MIRKGLSKTTKIVSVIVIIIIIIGVAVIFWPKGGGPVSEIKIGVVLPLSGKLAETGADLKQGIEFAVDEINSKGGIKNLGGAKIKLVYGDSAGDPSKGAAEAERLITEEKVVAMMGAYQSSVTKTVSEVCERYHVPHITVSSSPRLTQRGYKWFFRNQAHDEMYTEYLFGFIDSLNETYGNIKTIAVIHEDTEWGTACKDAIVSIADKRGYEVVKVVSYHAATVTSLDAEVASLKAANPDIVFANCYISDAILFVETAKKLDFNPKAIIAQDAGFVFPAYMKQVGKDGFYIFSRAAFNIDLVQVNSKIKEINDAYKAKYGVDLDEKSANQYTNAYVLYKAIEEAAKKSSPSDLTSFRTAIRDALRNIYLSPEEIIMPWKGVKFDETGQNILATGLVIQMMPDDGKYHIVWPKEYATRTLIYPMPKWSERG